MTSLHTVTCPRIKQVISLCSQETIVSRQSLCFDVSLYCNCNWVAEVFHVAFRRYSELNKCGQRLIAHSSWVLDTWGSASQRVSPQHLLHSENIVKSGAFVMFLWRFLSMFACGVFTVITSVIPALVELVSPELCLGTCTQTLYKYICSRFLGCSGLD